jgi:hypothetical protein
VSHGKPFRVTPPSAAARVRWPASFGQRFAITIDTEEEFDWNGRFDPDCRFVTATAALPDAVRRLADGGAPATLLVDHPIATDPRAVDAVLRARSIDGTAIGAQLHPWVNPPLTEDYSGPASFPGNLPEPIERAKLAELTSAIERSFGARPLVYRAGRYGLGPRTWRLLDELGYRVDTSCRAGFSYVDEGGPDFSELTSEPFHIANTNLVELPLTTAFTGALRRHPRQIFDVAGRVPRGRGILARLRALSRVPLTPEGTPLQEALEAVRVAVGDGLQLLAFSFHSPSLVPGHTPYVRSAGDLVKFWRWWDAVLTLLAQRGLTGISQAELLAALSAASASLARG